MNKKENVLILLVLMNIKREIILLLFDHYIRESRYKYTCVWYSNFVADKYSLHILSRKLSLWMQAGIIWYVSYGFRGQVSTVNPPFRLWDITSAIPFRCSLNSYTATRDGRHYPSKTYNLPYLLFPSLIAF